MVCLKYARQLTSRILLGDLRTNLYNVQWHGIRNQGSTSFGAHVERDHQRNSSILAKSHDFDSDGFPIGMNQKTRELAKDLLIHHNADDDDDTSNLDKESRQKQMWKRRLALARTITLIESGSPSHHEQAALLLTYLLQQPARSHQSFFRVGIAGPPGAGKSSLIEAFGQYILNLGLSSTTESDASGVCHEDIWKPGKLAVICVDPSSVTTGGSIMGDKTRMMELSRDMRAFVRPAPTQGAWGGLAPRTDDVIRVIAATDTYPLILLETVGLGQSELEVQQVVDMLVLAVPPGGGDSLQGVKKGIVEIADAVVVTKADGDLLTTARHTAADYRGAMQFLNVITEEEGSCHKKTPVALVSAFTGDGLPKLWKQICSFRQQQLEGGFLQARRQKQDRYWMWKNLRALVQQQISNDPELEKVANVVKEDLDAGRIPPRVAASLLLESLGRRP